MPINRFGTILFATNLEENCRLAFELAVSMLTWFCYMFWNKCQII